MVNASFERPFPRLALLGTLLAACGAGFIALYLKTLSRAGKHRAGGPHSRSDFTLSVDAQSFSHHKTRVCLNMIMKDEAYVLNKTLNSLVEELAGWFVCDTGSTDGSVELTTRFFERHQIPGRLVNHDWKGFSENRNRCLEEGCMTMSEQCDYWIIFDADQQMVNSSPNHLWELRLDQDAYSMRERTHGIYYSNIRLLKVGDLWAYHGMIHEEVRANASSLKGATWHVGQLPGDVYTIHDNIVTRSLQDDIFLLAKELESKPNDTRLHFFLAKAYHAVPGQAWKAIYHYSKRVQLHYDGNPGSVATLFYCRLSIAMMVEELYARGDLATEHLDILRDHDIIDRTSLTVADIAQLYEASSLVLAHRYEPYGHLANLYWAQEKDARKCYGYASKGIDVGSMGDANTNLFTTEKSVHTLFYTKCICGYHSGRYEDLLAACVYNLQKLPISKGSTQEWETRYMEASTMVLDKLGYSWDPATL